MSLNKLREEVCQYNRLLPATGLVTMHSGNASGYDPESGRMVIKPSGIDYDTLKPEMLVEVDVRTGWVMDTKYKPSVDLPHHLYLYRHMNDVRGVVHTHSNFATSFAACHQSIPLCLTAIADEFGGEIPCAPFCECDEVQIGQAILKHHNRAPAILLANHGVFTWGPTPKAAFKAAVMTEDVAKTVHLAMQLGGLQMLNYESAMRYHDRYQNRYGQKAA
jgi:L-ribulose-5-phosphate 4-epimerase